MCRKLISKGAIICHKPTNRDTVQSAIAQWSFVVAEGFVASCFYCPPRAE